MIIAFDIETGISDDALIFQPEWQEPRRKKDGELYANTKSVEEQKSEWEAKCALSAITGKVLAIGWAWKDGQTLMLDDEETILRNFWKTYKSYLEDGHTLVGHNIKFFDLPFLKRRSLKYGIKPLWGNQDDRYYSQIKDTMLEWGYEDNFSKKYASLDKLAKFFGVGAKTGSGADFAKLYLGTPEEKQQAIDYLANDLLMTYGVAERMFS